jgi:hypothetical protein
MHIGKCQAISGFIFWGCFVKMNYMSPTKVVAGLKIKRGSYKEKLVILSS